MANNKYANEIKKNGFAVKDTRSNQFMGETFGHSYKEVENRFLRARDLQSLPLHLKIVPIVFVEAQ